MSKLISFLFVLLLMASCYRTTKEEEFDMSLIIPPDSMISLLTDIHLLEGIGSAVKEQDSVLKVILTDNFNIILNKHGLDRKGFDENIHYYSYHAEDLDKIYEQVITNLGKMESEVNAGNEESKE